jgi:histone acetyltransferase (RNA polymerase elongator complex component)
MSIPDIEDGIPQASPAPEELVLHPDAKFDMYYVGDCQKDDCTDVTCPNCVFWRTSHLDKRHILRKVHDDGTAELIDWPKLQAYAYDLVFGNYQPKTEHDYSRFAKILNKKYSYMPSKCDLNYAYKRLIRERLLADHRNNVYGANYRNIVLERSLQAKKIRKLSGVSVATVLTSGEEGFEGDNGGCKFNCHYCPWEKTPKAPRDMPRSYLSKEPAVARANANDFDPFMQIIDRFSVTVLNGGYPDKGEIIVEGGTIGSYKKDYLIEFHRELYRAFNLFYTPEGERRTGKFTLQGEQLTNETAMCRVIGLTLETRPDCINPEQIMLFRELGCTRVQIGVQHLDDDILRLVNRGCYTRHTIEAIRMLKDCCFKVDIHLMPDLPGSTPEKDKAMLQRMLDDHELQVDDWKIYPCQTVDYSEILNWFNTTMTDFKEFLLNEGVDFDDVSVTNDVLEEYYQDFINQADSKKKKHYYVPYTHDFKKTDDGESSNIQKLFDVCKYVKRQMRPWIRINRLVRDIPTNVYVRAGLKMANAGQIIDKELAEKEGIICKNIRAHEVGRNEIADNVYEVIRVYEGSHGIDYFISIEDTEENIYTIVDENEYKIYGFIRLRLSYTPGAGFMLCLKNSALIRELHIYGQVTPVWMKGTKHIQHRGLGSRLIKMSEEIAIMHGYTKMSIIAGVGVKEYYRNKHDYVNVGTYVSKQLLINVDVDLSTLDNWKEQQWAIVRDAGYPIYIKPDIDPTILDHPLDIMTRSIDIVTEPSYNSFDPIWFAMILFIGFIIKKLMDVGYLSSF